MNQPTLADDETIMFCGNMEVVFHDTGLPHSRCGHRGRAVEAGITTAADQQRRGNIGPYRCLGSSMKSGCCSACVESLTPQNMQDSCCSAFCIHLDWVWFLDPADSFHPRNIMGKEWNMMING
jgi:hypothetical protein